MGVVSVPVIDIRHVTKKFGGTIALDDVNISIGTGTITAVIGPNGAGKTTLFNVITGVLKPDSGKVYFMGREITGLPPHRIARLGISRTHQIPSPFYKLSALENVMVAATYAGGYSYHSAEEIAKEILQEIGLGGKMNIDVSNLRVFELRLLEIAVALAARPKLLLLDEPFAGLNPDEAQAELELVQKLKNNYKITIIWIEHVIGLLKVAADRIIFLHGGRKLAEGSYHEIVNQSDLVIKYLGRFA